MVDRSGRQLRFLGAPAQDGGGGLLGEPACGVEVTRVAVGDDDLLDVPDAATSPAQRAVEPFRAEMSDASGVAEVQVKERCLNAA